MQKFTIIVCPLLEMLSNNMYCAEQIQIPPDMPPILKAYSKEIIRKNPEDIIAFSVQYFKDRLDDPPASSAGYRVTLDDLHGLQEQLSQFLKTQNELKRADYQQACEDQALSPDVLANILRLGFADQEVIDLYVFMGIAAALVSSNFDKTISNLFQIFKDDQGQSKIPTKDLINVFSFLASKDPTIPAENLQKLKDGATGEFVDYETYQKVFSKEE